MAEEQQGLRNLLETAQAALEEGRHQEATVVCRHVLRDYPDSVTAIRLLGESYLEAGRADEAVRAFEKVLGIDPFSVLARVGLGVLAEDRGEDERAIAQFRLAWEVAPTLPQLRNELIRLYRKRYGVGGRLRMTRVALANLHAQNGDLPRAIRQFHLLHDEEPGRPDVAIGLATALWQHDDEEEAANLCHQLLAERPRLARPLLILAAIGGDGGLSDAALVDQTGTLLATVRAFDPDAVLARDLLALHPSRTLQRFIDEPVALAPFDPADPDLAGTDELLGSQTGSLGGGAIRWEDVAGGLTGASSLKDGAAGAATTNGLASTVADEDDVDALFAAIDRQLSTVNVDDELSTFAPPSETGSDTPSGEAAKDEPLAGWETDPDDAMAPAPDELNAVERLTANWDNIDNELAAARPSDESPFGVTGMLGEMDLDFQPFDVESDAEPASEETPTFDPAKFSLPPLDGEDDDDLDLGLDADELGVAILPFNPDETGPKVKTGGLTFAELVRKEEQSPTSYTSGDSFANSPSDNGEVAGIASIFATRALAPSPEDRLLELQSLPADAAPPATAAASLPISAGETPPEAATLPDSRALAAADDPLITADTPSVGVMSASDEAGAKPAISFEALLSANTPRLELPEALYYPDATRPLLAPDEALLEATLPPTNVVPAQDADDEVGMGQLFSRLRHRKQERIETGELQVNRRLTPPASPHLAPDEVGDEHTTPVADVETFETAAMDEASLDDWIISLAPPELEEAKADEPIAVGEEDWLTGSPVASPPHAGLASAGGAEEDTLAAKWGIAPVPSGGVDAEAGLGALTLPEGPLPVAGWLAYEDLPSSEPSPLVSEFSAFTQERPESSGRAATNATPPPTNGHHAEELPTVPAPVSWHPVEPAQPRLAAQDQADQRAILESLVAADPGNHFARLTLAVAYGTSNPEGALTEYRRLIKDSAELVPEIIERLKEMIADGDAPARTHRVLGDAYMKLGQFDLAMAEFQRALSSRPRAKA